MQVGISDVGDDLYREIILDHFRNPRHNHPVAEADRVVEASNPLCGDEIVLTARLRDDVVDALGFTGRGCSISQASASMMCDEVTGLAQPEALAIAQRFKAMLTAGGDSDGLGDLEALQGVRRYPVRVKCAVLAWNALTEALGGPVVPVDSDD